MEVGIVQYKGGKISKLGDFYIFIFMSDTENQGKKPIYVVVLVKRTGKFIEVYSIHYTVYFGLYYMYRV